MKVEVIRKPLKYAGKVYAVGQTIEMSGKDARLFMAIARVQTYVTPVSEIPAAPASVSLVTREFDHPGMDAPEKAEAKRIYQRRDMKAAK